MMCRERAKVQMTSIHNKKPLAKIYLLFLNCISQQQQQKPLYGIYNNIRIHKA